VPNQPEPPPHPQPPDPAPPPPAPTDPAPTDPAPTTPAPTTPTPTTPAPGTTQSLIDPNAVVTNPTQFPTDGAELSLYSALPNLYRGECKRYITTATGAVASIYCEPQQGLQLVYTRFASSNELYTRYNYLTWLAGVSQDTGGTCPETLPREGPWQTGDGQTAGRLACFLDIGRPGMLWTFDTQTALLAALDTGHNDYGTLYQWWTNTSVFGS
jgi:hypothetical protein